MNTSHKKFHIALFMLLGMLFSLARTSYAQTYELDHDEKKINPGAIDTSQLSPASPVTVRFFRGQGKYALDEGADSRYQRSVMLSKYYGTFGTGYIAPWKLIPTGKNDTVESYAIESGSPFDRNKLRFALKDGTEIPAMYENGKWLLTLPGMGKGETYEGRYEAGRLVVPGASTVISAVGLADKLAKASRTKNLLRALKELEESQTDDLIEKLITQGENAGIVTGTGEVLEKITLWIRKNYTKWGLSNVDEADEIVSILVQNLQKTDVEFILGTLDELVQSGTEFINIKRTITETGKFKHLGDGSKWTLKYLTDNKQVFKGKKIEFELSDKIDDLGMRYFDVVDKSTNKWIYYEFKSVQKVPPSDFTLQFMKDLSSADGLDQIKWIFDGRKNPSNFKNNILKGIDDLPLSDELAIKLIGIEDKNLLKVTLKSKYDEIFKLIE